VTQRQRRVNTKVVIDIATGRVEERESFQYDGPWALATNVFAITQAAFRFYSDGEEATSTPAATQSSNVSWYAAANASFQLRLRLDETGSGSIAGATTDDYQLQYSKNSGAFTNVTGASTNIRGFNSSLLTDANTTTQRLTAGGGSFVAGEISEDGLLDDRQLTANNHTEHLYSLEIVAADVANGDTFDFRVLLNGATTNVTYSVTPRLTISKTAVAGGTHRPNPTRRAPAFAAAIMAAMTVGNLLTSTLAPLPDPPLPAGVNVGISTPRQAPLWEFQNLLLNTLASEEEPVASPFSQQVWELPRVPAGQIHVTTDMGYAEVEAEVEASPFIQTDWQNPSGKRQSFVWTDGQHRAEFLLAPFGQTAWPTPPAVKQPTLSSVTDQNRADFLLPPFTQQAWELPSAGKRFDGSFVKELLSTTLQPEEEEAASPFSQQSWDLPQVRAGHVQVTTAVGYSEEEVEVVASPFAQVEWTLPLVRKFTDTGWARELLSTTLRPEEEPAGTPFTQLEWALPRSGNSYVLVTVNTVTGEYPDPPPVAEGDPFRQDSWPNPLRKTVTALTWLQGDGIVRLIPYFYNDGTANLPLQNRRPQQPIVFIPLNILIGTLSEPVVEPGTPFSNTAWPNPAKRTGDIAVILRTSPLEMPEPPAAPGDPFRQNDWQNPPRKRLLALTWLQGDNIRQLVPYHPIDIADIFPVPRGPERRVIDFRAQNLLVSTLGVVVPAPFQQTSWPIPTVRPERAIADWIAFFTPGKLQGPFTPIDWPNPRIQEQQPVRFDPPNLRVSTLAPLVLVTESGTYLFIGSDVFLAAGDEVPYIWHPVLPTLPVHPILREIGRRY
jgi:hypothetical protein